MRSNQTRDHSLKVYEHKCGVFICPLAPRGRTADNLHPVNFFTVKMLTVYKLSPDRFN